MSTEETVQVIPKGTRLYYKLATSFITTEDVVMRGTMSVAEIDEMTANHVIRSRAQAERNLYEARRKGAENDLAKDLEFEEWRKRVLEEEPSRRNLEFSDRPSRVGFNRE